MKNEKASNVTDVETLRTEYESLVQLACAPTELGQSVDWDGLSSLLQQQSGWTERGASHLVQLVRLYGTFFLRNALALSVASGVEDGELNL